MKEQLEQLQSFDPAERAHGGEQLVELGLNRCADALLDHVANEFDTQVLATVAQAVLRTPADPKESRKAQELREWAATEVERSAIEESFLGEAPAPAGYRFELPPEDDATGLDPEREPLPARVPAAVVAGDAEPVEYRFDLPPETEPVEWDTDTAFEVIEYPAAPAQPTAAEPYEPVAPQPQFQPEPEPEPAPAFAPEPAYVADPEPAYVADPEPAYVADSEPEYAPETEPACTADPQPAYASDVPTPIGAPDPEPSFSTEVPTYIYWRPPADEAALVASNGDDPPPDDVTPQAPVEQAYEPAPVEELVDPRWPGIDLPMRDAREALAVDEPAPGEFRFAGPEPLAPPAEAAPETGQHFDQPSVEQAYEPAPIEETYEPAPIEETYEPAPAETPTAHPFPEYRFEAPDLEAAPLPAPAEDTTEPAEETGPPRTLAERLRARNA